MQRGRAPTANWGRPTMRRYVTAPQGQQAAESTTLAGAALVPEAACFQYISAYVDSSDVRVTGLQRWRSAAPKLTIRSGFLV